MKSFEEFIQSSEYGDFQQSTMWANIKEFWKRETITLNNKGNIVAGMSILIRKLPFFGYIMYVPRGPVGEIENKKVMKYFKSKINELQKKYHAFVIIIEPIN